MNIKDLPAGSFKFVDEPTNIKDLPPGSYNVIGDEPMEREDTPVQPGNVQTKAKGPYRTYATEEERVKSLNQFGSLAGLDVLGKTIGGTISKFLPKPKVVAPQNYQGTQDQFQKNFDYQQNKEISEDMPTFGQNVGAGLKLASTVVPAGKIIKSTSLAAKGAVSSGAYGLGESMTQKKNLPETAITTGAYALGGAAIGGSLDIISRRLPKLLSIFTGENSGTISTALKNPKLADQGIKNGDSALRKAVQDGAERSIAMRNSFINGEKNAIKVIASNANKNKLKYDKNVVMKAFGEVLEGSKITGKKALNITQSRVQANPGEVAKIKQANKIIRGWKDWTFEGVHELKQLIGGLTKFPAEGGGTAKSPVLARAYGKLNEVIKGGLSKQNVKLYEQINKKFSQNIDMYNDLVDTFNSGDPFTKLANSLSNNKDSMRQLLEFYEKKGGKSVLPIVAGRELGLEKQAAFGFLNPRSWIDFFVSPGTQGKIVTGVGKSQKSLKGFLPQQTPQFMSQQILKSLIPKKQE